jgi:hypothetical protein
LVEGGILNINNRFLNEARELEERWRRPGRDGISLLDHLRSRGFLRGGSVLLEGQRLMNEVMTEEPHERVNWIEEGF